MKREEYKGLVFSTTKHETTVHGEPYYDKLIARHDGTQTMKQNHERVRHLFDQYVEDYEKCYLPSIPDFTG